MNYVISFSEGWLRLRLSGEIDLYNVYTIKDKIKEQFQNNPAHLSIDVAEVSYLDSSGVGMLVEFKRIIEGKGMTYKLINLTPSILQLFKVTNLDKILKDNM